MCVNSIEWVSIRQDLDGKPSITIRRESHSRVIENASHYRPGEASQQRILRQIESQASEHLISLGLGPITGKFSLLLHLNLPPKLAPMIHFES